MVEEAGGVVGHAEVFMKYSSMRFWCRKRGLAKLIRPSK